MKLAILKSRMERALAKSDAMTLAVKLKGTISMMKIGSRKLASALKSKKPMRCTSRDVLVQF